MEKNKISVKFENVYTNSNQSKVKSTSKSTAPQKKASTASKQINPPTFKAVHKSPQRKQKEVPFEHIFGNNVENQIKKSKQALISIIKDYGDL